MCASSSHTKFAFYGYISVEWTDGLAAKVTCFSSREPGPDFKHPHCCLQLYIAPFPGEPMLPSSHSRKYTYMVGRYAWEKILIQIKNMINLKK